MLLHEDGASRLGLYKALEPKKHVHYARRPSSDVEHQSIQVVSSVYCTVKDLRLARAFTAGQGLLIEVGPGACHTPFCKGRDSFSNDMLLLLMSFRNLYRCSWPQRGIRFSHICDLASMQIAWFLYLCATHE